MKKLHVRGEGAGALELSEKKIGGGKKKEPYEKNINTDHYSLQSFPSNPAKPATLKRL